MNKYNTTFVTVLALSVVALTNCTKSNSTSNDAPKTICDSATMVHLPIAYVNIDSLLLNYQYAKDVNEELMREMENSQATINQRMRQLQQEVGEFQRKLENNAFLSRERAEQEQLRLQKKDQELQELNAKLTDRLQQKNRKMNEALRDTINTFLKDFNQDKRFQMIISNTANDNILWADPSYDITAEVIAALNRRMKK